MPPAGYKEDGTYDMRTKIGRELATRDSGNNVNSTMQGGDDACCIIL